MSYWLLAPLVLTSRWPSWTRRNPGALSFWLSRASSLIKTRIGWFFSSRPYYGLEVENHPIHVFICTSSFQRVNFLQTFQNRTADIFKADFTRHVDSKKWLWSELRVDPGKETFSPLIIPGLFWENLVIAQEKLFSFHFSMTSFPPILDRDRARIVKLPWMG